MTVKSHLRSHIGVEGYALSSTHDQAWSLVQFTRSVVSNSLWPHEPHAAHQASLSITSSQSSPKPMSIESVMPSSRLILCHPFRLLPSIFPSIRVFSDESALCIRLPKYWSFSFNIIPSNEHPGLISFRMDLLDLLAVQRTLKSLLQHSSSKASILWCSAEIDVFLELSCFFHDPADVGNLISGSSAFSKTSLNIWNFMVHVLLKHGLENFEHYFTSMWNECNCAVVWAF